MIKLKDLTKKELFEIIKELGLDKLISDSDINFKRYNSRCKKAQMLMDNAMKRMNLFRGTGKMLLYCRASNDWDQGKRQFELAQLDYDAFLKEKENEKNI